MRLLPAPLLPALGLACALAVPAYAQDPAPAPSTGVVEAPSPDNLVLAETVLVQSGFNERFHSILHVVRETLVDLLARQTGKRAAAEQIVDEVLLPDFDAHRQDLLRLQAALWAQNFSTDELRGLQAFFASPLGGRYAAIMTKLAPQSFAVGQAWGRQITGEALRRHADELRKRGILL